jgi:hypothetical protein
VNLALENYRKEKQKYRFMEEYSYVNADESEIQADNSLDIENIPREEVLDMIKNLPPDTGQCLTCIFSKRCRTKKLPGCWVLMKQRRVRNFSGQRICSGRKFQPSCITIKDRYNDVR